MTTAAGDKSLTTYTKGITQYNTHLNFCKKCYNSGFGSNSSDLTLSNILT